MKKFIAIIIILAIGILAIGGIALSIYPQKQTESPIEKRVEVAAALRCQDDNGWFAIDDEFHEPINIGRIHVYQGYIIVHYTFTASTIYSFIVSPDETFVQGGVFFGSSVFRDHVVIAVSRMNNGRIEPVDASSIRSELGNIWIYGLFGVDENKVEQATGKLK